MSAAATPPTERHKSPRIGWLRAAVVGANDAIVSTSATLFDLDGQEVFNKIVGGYQAGLY
jgi:VIT1/CCC1 family predicted Fe2+/Mn2+ transporter